MPASETAEAPSIQFIHVEAEAPTWDIVMGGSTVGLVRLNFRSGKFEVAIDTAFGYSKTVQKAVDEAEHQTVEDIKAAVLRGYTEHLTVLQRLKVVDREGRPKFITVPMGGKPKN
ncbi:hypothetical protein [Streptomyces sp. NPDC005281]|uniref:hypothetical protein n=1 Tax=Streptomyces sp. NPDC005281 TaxID=3155712 RepID=UPI0033B4646A